MRALQVVMAALVLASSIGCGGPGPVGPRAYEHAQALYSLANRQANDRIDILAEQIDKDIASGDVTRDEAEWLRDILTDARAGEWKSAAKAARRIMEDQVER